MIHPPSESGVTHRGQSKTTVDLPVLLALLAVLVLMALPILSRRLHGHVNYIEPFELKKRLDSDEELLILDLRPSAQFRRAHIQGAVNVRPRQLSAGIDAPGSAYSMDPEAGKQIVLVCQSDLDSVRTAKSLRHRGYSDVVVMKGGMFRWKRQHLPTVTVA